MYTNIGDKIKLLAIGTFIVEAIGSIVAGIILAMEEDELYCLLCLIGPIVAWVSSWILYAFGELVEKTCDNENNTRQILNMLNEKTCENKITSIQTSTANKASVVHKWRCDGCGNVRTQSPCECCGKE